MQILSQKLQGVPKSAQHKARIAASQRRRHAARRALKAIEALHSAASPPLENCRRSRYMPSSLALLTNSSPAFQQKQTRAEVSLKKACDDKILCSNGCHEKIDHFSTKVVSSYKGLLREYRELQKELSPWMHAFEEDNSRRPTLVDVESTKIPWLAEKFKDYTVLREKLFIGIPELRCRINTAKADSVPDQTSPTITTGDSATAGTGSLSGWLTAADNIGEYGEKNETLEARVSPPIGW